MNTGIPDLMARILHKENRRAAIFALLLGIFAPLTALLMMHYGGQGEWSNSGFVAWAGRFVALCCVTTSAPKLYRFFVKACEGHKLEALGLTAAVEVAAMLAVSQVIGLYAFCLQVVVNTLVFSNSITMDQRHIKAAERHEREEEQVSDTLKLVHLPIPEPKKRKPAAKKRVVAIRKTGTRKR